MSLPRLPSILILLAAAIAAATYLDIRPAPNHEVAAVPDAPPSTPVDTAGAVTTPSGLTYIDTVIGTGAVAEPGHTVVVHYTGWLFENAARGRKFDSSVDRDEPFDFPLGAHHVIQGWDEGVAGMKVGGKRTLIIPAELGYGARGAGGVIPPNATLIFDVSLLEVR